MIQKHQWTHDGDEVLFVRCGLIRGDFTWPTALGAVVEAPDWSPVAECGGGLHGWPWGLAVGDGKDPDYAATWMVFGALPADVVDLGGKAKVRRAVVRYVGTWEQVLAYVNPGMVAWVAHHARGAASATGEQGAAAVTGLNGRAQAGPWGCLALAWQNEDAGRCEMRCARVGDGTQSDLLKPHVWYRLDDAGVFVEVKP